MPSKPRDIKEILVKTVMIGGVVVLGTLIGIGVMGAAIVGIVGASVALPALLLAAAMLAVPTTLGVGVLSLFAARQGKKQGEADILYPNGRSVQRS